MPAGPFICVNNAIEKILDGTIETLTDTFVAVLVTAAHTAAPTDTLWSDISANQATGSGYTAGGQVVSPLSVSRVGGVVTLDCATNPLWTPATVSAKWIYLVRRVGGSLAPGDLILGYMDLDVGGGNLSSVASDFEVTWPLAGLLTVQRAA